MGGEEESKRKQSRAEHKRGLQFRDGIGGEGRGEERTRKSHLLSLGCYNLLQSVKLFAALIARDRVA
eukprot:706568-Hanusia_phi.AAC.1